MFSVALDTTGGPAPFVGDKGRGFVFERKGFMNAWIQSFSGRQVTPLQLKPEQVRYEDIPHALAQKVRFNGHLQLMGYSVAQHCVLGAMEMFVQYAPPGVWGKLARDEIFKIRCRQLAFLLHEVSEVYLPDVPAPIKGHLFVSGFSTDGEGAGPWEALERQHADVVFDALGLKEIRPLIDSDEVHTIDRRMLLTEKRDLMGEGPGKHNDSLSKKYEGLEPLNIRIDSCWRPEEAASRFHQMYINLREEVGL